MISSWPAAIEFVLKMEGGEEGEHDPNDPGGFTKFGISSKAYPTMDIKNLTREQAVEIYRRDYWSACHCDELPAGFDIAVFDAAVNMGVVKSRRLLQIALETEVDGIIGEKTIRAAFAASPRRLTKLLAVRLAEYARIMAENPKLLVFATNWSFRVLSLAKITDCKGVA